MTLTVHHLKKMKSRNNRLPGFSQPKSDIVLLILKILD